MESVDWDRKYASDELLWSATPNRFLVAETERLQAGRALDLACGEGRNAVWLAERGWRVTGIDFSAVAIGKAERLAASRGVEVDWVCADLRAYGPAAGAYDLVVVFYLQLPTAELAPVVAAAAAAVAAGGTLLLVGHDRTNLDEGHGGPRDPEVLWSAPGLAGSLGGFELERSGTVLRPVDTADGARSAVDTLVRARRPG